jgi:hypothetical protein
MFLRHWGRRLSLIAASLGVVVTLAYMVALWRVAQAVSWSFDAGPFWTFFALWGVVLLINVAWVTLFTSRAVQARFRN